MIDYVYFSETAVISEYQMLEDGEIAEVAMIGRESATGLLALLSSSCTSCWAKVSV
jgi:hypothetical protein